MCKTRRLLLIGLFVSGNMIFAGCGKKEDVSRKEERALPVKVINVSRGNIEELISLTGDIKGQKEVQVYATVPGKLTKKVKDIGESVKKDDVLALIDRDEEALQFSQAEIKSPIDGEVTRYFADLGESVFPAQPMPRSPVVMVADMDKVRVIINIIEKNIGRVKVNQKAKIYVDTYPEKAFIGYVSAISKSLDPMTRTAQAEITVDNPDHLLRPGMYARIKLIVKWKNNVIVIPRGALIERDDENIVFTVENSRAKKKSVSCGTITEKEVELKKGLSEGEEIIIEGNYGLIEGTIVGISKESISNE